MFGRGVPAEVVQGDLLVMLDVGAYQVISMSNFNTKPRPATLLVSRDRIETIRQADTHEDVFQGDVTPEYLKD